MTNISLGKAGTGVVKVAGAPFTVTPPATGIIPVGNFTSSVTPTSVVAGCKLETLTE